MKTLFFVGFILLGIGKFYFYTHGLPLHVQGAEAKFALLMWVSGPLGIILCAIAVATSIGNHFETFIQKWFRSR